MTKPEIIGSIRSTYTRAVCMVCEEKRDRVCADGQTAARAGNLCYPPVRQNAGNAPRRSRTLRIEGDCNLSRSELPGPIRLPVRSSPRRAHRTMGLTRQRGDGPHPHPDMESMLRSSGLTCKAHASRSCSSRLMSRFAPDREGYRRQSRSVLFAHKKWAANNATIEVSADVRIPRT